MHHLAAFALNRLLSPARALLCMALLPWVAAPINRRCDPLVARAKAWWYGQLSALVEPFAAVAGAIAVTMMRPLLPYALAFAAGAMIFVTVEEVIPESQSGGNSDMATLGAIVGFAVMMTLDVALG